ncbi:MAG: DUF4349 domain-containing protein [Lachnospiraceae bacterium]|nr:DUF4349 domain-containing protein [Lachnospiraceae bacterium]
MKKIRSRVAVLMLLGVMLCSFVACGYSSDTAMSETIYGDSFMMSNQSSNHKESNESYDMITEEMDGAPAEAPMSDSSTGADVTTNRKLIRTVTMEVETEAFETMMTNVENKVSSMGGYIEHAYTYNGSAYSNSARRYAEMTVRVPDSELETFVEQVAGFSNVVSKTTSTEDITLEYVDTEGLRDMYLAEEQSLLALLEKAESVEDISYLTSQLSQVRYNIENLESRLLKYDDLVEYATIHLYIEEVEVYTPVVTEEKTFGEEIKDGFTASLQDIWNSVVNFVKNTIINLPYIIRFFVVVGLIILAIRLIIVIIKKVIKKNRAKKVATQNHTNVQAVAVKNEAETAQKPENTKNPDVKTGEEAK